MSCLDKIICINLKRRQDKLISWVGAAQARRVPLEAIEVFHAHDAQDYESNHAVIHAAAQDFPFWNKLLEMDDWIHAEYLGKGSLCCLWSMQSVIRSIAERAHDNKAYIMIVDRYYLRTDWGDLWKLFLGLGGFDIFQMHYWYPEDPTHMLYRASKRHLGEITSYHPDIGHGLGGIGDSCLAMTPVGAQKLLDWSAEKPWHLIEILLGEIGYNQEKDLSDCYYGISDRWSSGPIRLESLLGISDSDREKLDAK